MSKEKAPVTAAVRVLREHEVSYEEHLYKYEEKGGTAASAKALGVDEHAVIKTLVMEDEEGAPLVVLMHGDRSVATGVLAKQIGKKKITPCDPDTANKHSGYVVGGTSPFGFKREVVVYAQESIFELERIWINGGKRGFLVSMDPAELERVLKPVWVNAAQPA
jgi:Cys-tRNA(Pro) deacylase